MIEDDKNNTLPSLSELEERILNENNQTELQNAIDLFNLNIKKKQILRTSTISNLQDKALEQMAKRLEKKSGEFSNKDLLDYYKVLHDSENSAINKNLETTAPMLQINQQNVNIDSNTGLGRESRERVADVVKSILNKYALDGDNKQ